MRDCKIYIVKQLKNLIPLITLLSCASKHVQIVQTQQQDLKPLNNAKIDTYELEYQSNFSSFVLKNGWSVEIFEPIINSEEEWYKSSEDRDVYEIDEIFSEILTRDEFPAFLTKFDSWFLEGYGKYNIPVELNKYVEYYIYLFTETRFREHYEKWLRRYFAYSGIIRNILVSQGLPDDMVFVAMAESGFSNRAVSPMGAVGMWQFIYGTGIRYGLRVDDWVDERRDIFLSTIAASKYLKELYQMFGHWYLAWAAYNAGEKRIEKALRITKSKDFWEILRKGAIPKETAGYVPKIIALALITKNLEKFGFKKLDYYKEPIEIDNVRISFPLDIFSIAALCNCSVEDIYELNPHLKNPVTPPYEINLNVPKGKGKNLQQKLAYIQQNFSVSYDKYYSISFSPYPDKNFSKKIIAGVLSLIPKKQIHTANLNEFLSDGMNGFEINQDGSISIPVEVYVRSFITYKVKKNESIFKISRRFGVKPEDIIRMNNLASIKSIKPGMIIKIPVNYHKVETKSTIHKTSVRRNVDSVSSTSVVIHRVKKGETLEKISKKYGVSVESIRRFNNLKVSSKLKQGQILRIPVRLS